MKLHGHKGTIIWGEILVYATALGAAKKVLKDLKQQILLKDTPIQKLCKIRLQKYITFLF